MLLTNCATSSLAPFTPSEEQPWDRARVMHFYRRAGFGASPAEIEQALADGPRRTVSRVLNAAGSQAPPAAPEWANWDYADFVAADRDSFEAYTDWAKAFMMRAIEGGVREKLELFWSGHFVTRFEDYNCPSYYYRYMKDIGEHAFLNFKDFVVAMTRTPAMLFFLNGFQNTRQNPNENYARELFELFTLGVNNGYTQEDIVEASRALTGLNGWTSYCGPVNFVDWGWDQGVKTVFGRSGAYNYAQLIDVLFEERAPLIAEFICRKLYAYYVNPQVDEVVVQGLARTFLDNNFLIYPVLRQLFLSEHFYDTAHVGARIKNPLELQLTWMREGGFSKFDNQESWGFWAMVNMGQFIGQPPDVAGWPGDRAWIDSNRLALRWEFMDGFAWAVYNDRNSAYVELARRLTQNSDDVNVVARALVDYFVAGQGISEEAYELATDAFKWEVPENYYTNGTWSLDYPSTPWQCVVLMRHIGRLPEFQLC